MTNTKNLAAAIALAWVMTASGLAHAGAPAAIGPMQLGAPAAPPRAFLEFCERNPRNCQVSREMVQSQIETLGLRRDAVQTLTATITGPPEALTVAASPPAATPTLDVSSGVALPEAPPAAAQGATLVIDSSTWSTVNRVNAKVNRNIVRKTDILNNGVEERWSTPLEEGAKFGDCEDYALEKRRALIAEGFPPSALSIAVVTTSWNTSHAVLLVAGDKGEYVLDNLSPWVVPWNEAPYVFKKRQVAGDAFRWARVAPQVPSPEKVRPLLIARAD